MSDTIETLFTAQRPGYGNRPALELVMSLEQYDGSRYIQLEIKTEGSASAKSRVTIRQKEIPGVIEALTRAVSRICDAPESFTEHLSHHEYAASEACPFK